MHQWNISDDHQKASLAAAEFLYQQTLQVLECKESCHIALPGGNTPLKSLQAFAQCDLPWQRIHFYPGDERCFPAGHAERNDVMLQENFCRHIEPCNLHPMPAELGPDAAVASYRKEFGADAPLDIAFLGMGEDGHTASLFPDNAALESNENLVAVYNSPKPPDTRISFGLNAFRMAKTRIILASGRGKRDILLKVRAGVQLPVNRIGDVHWFIDQAACPDDS